MSDQQLYFLKDNASREALDPPSPRIILLGWILIVLSFLGIVAVVVSLRIPSSKAVNFSVSATTAMPGKNKAILQVDYDGDPYGAVQDQQFVEIDALVPSSGSPKLKLKVEEVKPGTAKGLLAIVVADSSKTLYAGWKGQLYLKINKRLISKLINFKE